MAASDTAKAFPWFARFEKILSQVYTFFSRSSVHTAQLVEMQTVLNHPQLRLQKPTVTRWMSLENAVDALRKCFRSVKLVLDAEANDGDATALGLAMELGKPEFIALLYLLSDILWTVSRLSIAFQSPKLHLLGIEKLLKGYLAELEELKGDIYKGGYLMHIENDYPDVYNSVDRASLQARAEAYIAALITNIKQRFPQLHLLSLLGCVDPQGVSEATPAQVFELASEIGVDGSALWNEVRSYKSLAATIEPQDISGAVKFMWNETNRQAMTKAYPLISNLLVRLAVLPASSAEVERVFSAMKRLKTPIRNRLKSSTLDILLRITMNGPESSEYDPMPAALRWKSMGNRRLTLTSSTVSCTPPTAPSTASQ